MISTINKLTELLFPPKRTRVVCISQDEYEQQQKRIPLTDIKMYSWQKLDNHQPSENYGAYPCLSIYFLFDKHYYVGHIPKVPNHVRDEVLRGEYQDKEAEKSISLADKAFTDLLQAVQIEITNGGCCEVYIFGQNYYPQDNFSESEQEYEEHIKETDKSRNEVVAQTLDIGVSPDHIHDYRTQIRPSKSYDLLVDNVIYHPEEKAFYLNNSPWIGSKEMKSN